MGIASRICSGPGGTEPLQAIDVAEATGLDPFDLLDAVLSYGKPAPTLEPIMVTGGKDQPKRKGKRKPKKKR